MARRGTGLPGPRAAIEARSDSAILADRDEHSGAVGHTTEPVRDRRASPLPVGAVVAAVNGAAIPDRDNSIVRSSDAFEPVRSAEVNPPKLLEGFRKEHDAAFA